MSVAITDREHPLYKDHNEEWSFFLEAYEGGSDYIDGDNLFTHRLELDEDFENRKERAYYLNYCSAVIESYTNFIFSKEIIRPSNEIFAPFLKNVTGSGDDIDTFMRKVSNYSGACGFVYVLFNFRDLSLFPTSEDSKVPLNIVKNYNLYPYLTMHVPSEVVDFSVDTHGNFDWILIEEDIYEDSDPTIDREIVTIRNLITRDYWVKYEKETGEQVGSKIDNPFGFVPVVLVKNMGESYEGLSLSTIKDIAYVNRAIFNWCSNIDEMIERQTFSQLTCPDDGSLAEQAEAKKHTGEDPLVKVGTAAIFTFPANAGHPPRFISPDTSQIEVIWEMVLSHIKQIYIMAGLAGTAVDVSASSGRAKQQQFYSIEANLNSKSSNLEKAEMEIMKMYYEIMTGKPVNDESIYQVVYPKSFDVLNFVDYLKYTFDVISKSISDKLTKYLAKEVALKLLKSAPDSVKEEVIDEIENKEASEIVENVRAGNVKMTFGQSVFGSSEYKSPSDRTYDEKEEGSPDIKKDTGEGRPMNKQE